jgi:tetratricopeptide (TPR) repeat protein
LDAKKEADTERNNARSALEKLMKSQENNAILKRDNKLKEGMALQDDKKYQEAMKLYREALDEVREYNAGIDSPAVKIDTIPALKYIENCQNQEVLSIGFYSLINSGDSLARIGPEYYSEAKKQYIMALGMDIDNEQAQQKISLLNVKIDTEAGKYIDNAELFLLKGYKKYALEWLLKAQKLKGQDPKIESLMAQCK